MKKTIRIEQKENTETFESLQLKKVNLANELAQKLITMIPRLSAAEQLNPELVTAWLQKYIAAMRKLLDLIKTQKSLCEDQQCKVFLDQEIVALEGGKKTLGAIQHLEHATIGIALEIAKVRETLAMIVSRADSLNILRTA